MRRPASDRVMGVCRALLALGVVGLLAACGDARLSAEGEAPESPGGRPVPDGGPDTGLDDSGGPDDSGITPPVGEASCVLIPAVAGDIFVGAGNSITLGVYQYSIATGDPMVDATVGFEILEAGAQSALSTLRARTDEDGLADVRLIAGAVTETVTVKALSDCARPIEFEVEVMELPSGDLRVGFNYPFRDVYDVSPLQVDLFDSDALNCRDIERDELPPDALRTEETGSVAGTASFETLGIETSYTVLVTGFGTYGERAARGCLDGVTLREGAITEVTVDMYLLPLNPPGTYDVLSYWDFRDALSESGEVGRIIVDILDIFEDPGAGIVDFILDLVEEFVGGLISGAISLFLDLTGLDDVIGDAINDLIDSSPLLSDIVTIGRDLRAIIAELEVISKLEIGKVGGDYAVFGIDEWIGLSLYWRLGCDETSPPDCGRFPVVIDGTGLGLLRGEWTGRVLGYNRLEIDRHPVDFEYGRLILFILEGLVLPAIAGDSCSVDADCDTGLTCNTFGRCGPLTLEDLMAAIINCDGIGDFVAGGDGDCRCALGACICDDDVEGFCEDFISFAFGGIFTSFVSALSFDSVLEIRGSCTLVNTDADLRVDQLLDGEYVGDIRIGSAPTPFTASFCGVREGLDIVAACLTDR